MADAHPPHHQASSSRPAFTLSETLIATAVLGLLLIVAALATEGVRTELKRRQAVALLASLEEALTAYQQATGAWPVDPATEMPTAGGGATGDLSAVGTSERRATGPRVTAARPDETSPEEFDASGDRIIASLSDVPSSRTVLETIPAVLRIKADTPDGGYGPPPGAWGTLQDPWGHRLRCLTAGSPSPVHRKAVAARNGRPIFISAGVDGRFGETDLSHASDNLRSDELRRE